MQQPVKELLPGLVIDDSRLPLLPRVEGNKYTCIKSKNQPFIVVRPVVIIVKYSK
jgi:hypothetical protein